MPAPRRRRSPMLFRWFESLIDPFKDPSDAMPPTTPGRFYLFYLRQVWPMFAAVLVVGFFVSIIEVSLFAFIGRLVDMAKVAEGAAFFREHGGELLWMAFVALVARPFFNALHDLLVNQAIVPNVTSRIRWQHHRYVIRQSLAFFQNDFAGRIANRIMQTGSSLRESAVQIVDAIWYVAIYTGSAIVMFAQADAWLPAPLALWRWSHGQVTGGAIALSTGLVIRINNMSGWIMWVVNGIFENIGTVQDGMATIAQPRAVQDAPGAMPLEVTRGEVRFAAVHFHYGKAGDVIAGLDLTVRAGEKIGLVGPSGAGKSTLVNVLLRLYDLEGGRILVDGQDIARVTQESLRSQIGVVTQDTSLLHRSIRDT